MTRATLRRHNQALGASEEVSAKADDPLVKRAISYYQSASFGFTHHLLDWKPTPAE